MIPEKQKACPGGRREQALKLLVKQIQITLSLKKAQEQTLRAFLIKKVGAR